MTKPLKIIAANDVIGALGAIADVLDDKIALFVTSPEVNGKMPEVLGLPSQVDDDVALIVETSGSTGNPKRIAISREALIASAHAAAFALDAEEHDSQWLLTLPINYIAGLNVLVRSAIAGRPPVILNTAVPFTPDAFGQAASHLKAEKRFTSLVPAQLARLSLAASHDKHLLQQLRRFDAILVGGQAVDFNVIDQMKGLGVTVVTTYGMTETCGGCVFNGMPLGGVEFRLIEGRVAIKAPMLANVETDESGFFITQDAGEVDENGHLSILGRLDRVIISGGIKISLDRVEQLALRVNGVDDVAAHALQDDKWGERVGIAYVGSPEVADDLARSLAQELGPAGKPVRVLRVDRLPKTANAKNDLRSVKKLFEG